MYCTLGLCGEAGEIAEKVKKSYRDNISRDEAWINSVKKELGDVCWYLTAISNELGISMEEVLTMNYNKLLLRRETNTLHGSGDNREEDKQLKLEVK